MVSGVCGCTFTGQLFLIRKRGHWVLAFIHQVSSRYFELTFYNSHMGRTFSFITGKFSDIQWSENSPLDLTCTIVSESQGSLISLVLHLVSSHPVPITWRVQKFISSQRVQINPVISDQRDPRCLNWPGVLHTDPDPHLHIMMMKWQLKKSQQALTVKRILKCPFTPANLCLHNQFGQLLLAAGIYMPYIEGPHMDWTVNGHLYHRFLKWHLKCKNILECKLVTLPECQQCKKVITWSGDCRMDQYVSWNLSSNELTLDTIWGEYKEYCKPQIQWGLGQIWFTDGFQTRKLQCGWVVQCHAGTSKLSQIPPRDNQNTTQGHLLFFSERWRFCVQDHQWWQCQLGQIPCK